MTTEKTVKMAVAKSIFATVTADASIAKPRKEFIAQFREQTGSTERCASAYYQMNRNAAQPGGKLYKHHLTPKQRAAKSAESTEAIARPE